jgi:hypothetical protein
MGSYRSLESVFFYLPVMIWFMRMSYGCSNRGLPFLPVCFVGVLIIGFLVCRYTLGGDVRLDGLIRGLLERLFFGSAI